MTEISARAPRAFLASILLVVLSGSLAEDEMRATFTNIGVAGATIRTVSDRTDPFVRLNADQVITPEA